MELGGKIYLILLAAMSGITFLVFAIDKIKSKKETNARTPEIVMLSLITFGGAVGGLAGMYLLRHKTNFATKFHFGITVWLAFLVQVALALMILVMKEGRA